MFKFLGLFFALAASAHAFEVNSCTVEDNLTLLFATASTVPVFNSSKNIVSSSVTATELGYVSGVTSNIQTQLNAKQSALTFIDSLVNTTGSVSLVGDSATPGNSKYYGTDSGGSLGYHTITAGGVTSVTATSPLTSSGGATPNLTITSGNLTIPTNPNLSISGGTGAVIGAGTALSLTGASIVESTSSVLTLGGATNAVLGTGVSIQVKQASTSQSGYLSSADWNTFHGKGSGSVTSVGLSLPSIFSVSGSPVSTTGTLTGTLATQSANTVFAGPTTGADATPTFRSLVSDDIPSLSDIYLPLTGGEMTGEIAMAGNGITNLGAIIFQGGDEIAGDGAGGLLFIHGAATISASGSGTFSGLSVSGEADLGSIKTTNINMESGSINQLSTLIDTGNVESVDVNSRRLYWSDGISVMADWEAGTLGTIEGDVSIDWENHQLTTGSPTLDWANQQLIDTGGQPTVNWNDRTLINDANVTKISWEASILNDDNGTKAMDFQNRRLYASDGTTVNLDYQTANSMKLGKLSQYNGIATVTNGVPSEYAQTNLTAQGAAIAATTLYAVPSTGVGLYRVCYVASITRASTTSSVLGGTAGFQIRYTDADDSVVKTTANAAVTSSLNTTGTTISGCQIANAKASTNLQYLFDYTSVGVTSMQYNLHVRAEAL